MNKVLVILLILLTAFSACRKKGQPNRVRRMAPDALVKKIHESALSCPKFSSRARVSVEMEGMKNSFNAQIRMKIDSVIWISISPALGIEVIRAVITKDSVFVIDRLNKKAIRAGTNYLDEKMSIPVQFSELQQILLGNVVDMLPEKKISGIDSTHYKLTARDEDREYQMWVEQEHFRPSRLNTRHFNQKENINVSFDDYKATDCGTFAHKRKINIRTSMKINSSMDFSSVKTGDNINFPFRIPDTYSYESY